MLGQKEKKNRIVDIKNGEDYMASLVDGIGYYGFILCVSTILCIYFSKRKKKLNGFCRHNIALIPVPFFLPDMLPKVKISIFGDLGSLLIFKKKLSTQK